MPYKYVLVGMYYEGEEPVLYPDCNHSQEPWCECEQSVADAIDHTLRVNQPKITFLDTGFLEQSKDWTYITWSWHHIKEMYRRFLWKAFVFLYNR